MRSVVMLGHHDFHHAVRNLFGVLTSENNFVHDNIQYFMAVPVPRAATTAMHCEIIIDACRNAITGKIPSVNGMLLVDDGKGLFRLGYTAKTLKFPFFNVFESTSLGDIKQWVSGQTTAHEITSRGKTQVVVLVASQEKVKDVVDMIGFQPGLELHVIGEMLTETKKFRNGYVALSYDLPSNHPGLNSYRSVSAQEIRHLSVVVAKSVLVEAEAKLEQTEIDRAIAYEGLRAATFDHTSKKSTQNLLRESFVEGNGYLARCLGDIGSENLVKAWAALWLRGQNPPPQISLHESRKSKSPTGDFQDLANDVTLIAVAQKLTKIDFDEIDLSVLGSYAPLLEAIRPDDWVHNVYRFKMNAIRATLEMYAALTSFRSVGFEQGWADPLPIYLGLRGKK